MLRLPVRPGRRPPGLAPTWPGGTYGGGLIPAIVVTASGPRHLVDHTPYNHYSLLTTIEENWHLATSGTPVTGRAASWR